MRGAFCSYDGYNASFYYESETLYKRSMYNLNIPTRPLYSNLFNI